VRGTRDCKRGRHRTGVAGAVGGGILRRTCRVCGSVIIDLTGAEVGMTSDLFARNKLTSMFISEATAEKMQNRPERSFGLPPVSRRVAYRALV